MSDVWIEYVLGGAAAIGVAVAVYTWRIGVARARAAAVTGERARIARELHDTLAQGLAGVAIQIDTALRKFGDDPDLARHHIELAQSMVRSSLTEVRRSIWILRAPVAVEPDHIGQALEQNLAQLTESTGIVPRLTVSGTPRALEPEVERNLLRVAYEAVTNAVRHAAPRTVQVDLRFEAEALSLRVRDDGRGFDPQAALDQGGGVHFGLVGISERAQALGGEMRLVSRVGEGTEIVCRLPYRCRMSDPLEGAPARSGARRGEEEGASL